MERQLALITTPPSWKLDAETKEIGRRGIARARAALAANRPVPPALESEDSGPGHPDAA